MLYWLFQQLAEIDGAFNVFGYITLRTILGALTALLISLVMGPWFIRRLVAQQQIQPIRKLGPETHLSKAGTPTMGGALILISIGLTTLLWADLANRFIWVVLLVTLGFGWVGWVDDYRKVVEKDSRGLPARWKYLWQSVAGLGAALALWYTAESPAETALHVPFFKDVILPMGAVAFIGFTYLVIVGSSNAVNLTDGLDGLAIMPCVMVAGALGVFAYVTGNVNFAAYLHIPYVPGVGEMLIFLGTLAGAGLGFLWFNTYPAQVFMGDVGALALGGALGTNAVIVRQEIVLFIMGGVFVAETVSVMLQVGYFKYTRRRYGTGRRIFRMAPLHHHFEVGGVKESQVVVRFWIVTMMLVLFGLSTLKLR